MQLDDDAVGDAICIIQVELNPLQILADQSDPVSLRLSIQPKDVGDAGKVQSGPQACSVVLAPYLPHLLGIALTIGLEDEGLEGDQPTPANSVPVFSVLNALAHKSMP